MIDAQSINLRKWSLPRNTEMESMESQRGVVANRTYSARNHAKTMYNRITIENREYNINYHRNKASAQRVKCTNTR